MRPIRIVLGIGFAVELLRAVLLMIVHPFARVGRFRRLLGKVAGDRALIGRYTDRPGKHAMPDWPLLHILDWRQIHIFLKNMPAGLKGSRYHVDRMDGRSTKRGRTDDR